MEHTVWFDEPSQRWFKLTHPGEFGRFPEIDHVLDKRTQKWRPEVLLRLATLGEYLARLRLANELFGDDLRLEGIAGAGAMMRALISQPHLVGEAPAPAEIAAFMEDFGFRATEDFAFYDPHSHLAAFDAQPRNFLETPRGVLPIDLILTPVEGELRTTLAEQVRG